MSPALPGAPRLVVGAPWHVTSAPSYSEGRQECPPMVWDSPEQRLEYNCSSCEECNTSVVLMMGISHHKVKEVRMQRDPSPGRHAECNSLSEHTRFCQSCQSHPEQPDLSDGNQGRCWWVTLSIQGSSADDRAELTCNASFDFPLGFRDYWFRDRIMPVIVCSLTQDRTPLTCRKCVPLKYIHHRGFLS